MSDELTPVETTIQIAPPSFDYKNTRVKDIILEAMLPADLTPELRQKLQAAGGYMPVHGGKTVTKVIIGDEEFVPSGRFWSSLYSRFNLNSAFFKYFTHNEVFQRISERDKNDKIRVTIERNKNTGDARLLAATGLNKPVVVYDDLLDILKAFHTDKGGIRYHNGVVISSHTPRVGQSQFKIGADKFSNKFELHAPVDGYGQPAVFLALLRWICSNGAVGFAPAFKTSLVIGGGNDNTKFAIQRALDSFTNDEGYAMMRGRFETAARSWASLREHQELYKTMLSLQNDPVLAATIGSWKRANAEDIGVSTGNALMQAFDRSLGNPYKIYNNDPNMMGSKKQRNLPMPCKVYDMLNFATELASHHVSEGSARTLQGWVGQMLSEQEFDLNESCDQFTDWQELFFAEAANANKPK